jgi:hypothetical protein
MNGFDPGARNGRSHCQSPTLGYVLLAFQAVKCAKFRYAPSKPSRQIVPRDVQLVRVYIGARSNHGVNGLKGQENVAQALAWITQKTCQPCRGKRKRKPPITASWLQMF